MAIQNCEANNQIDLYSSSLTFLQADGSHFSVDEQGILAQRAVYFVLYLILTAIHLHGVWLISRTGSVHMVRRLSRQKNSRKRSVAAPGLTQAESWRAACPGPHSFTSSSPRRSSLRRLGRCST